MSSKICQSSLRIYCRNVDILFVDHENINTSKYLNHFGLHLNHIGTQILTVNILNKYVK